MVWPPRLRLLLVKALCEAFRKPLSRRSLSPPSEASKSLAMSFASSWSTEAFICSATGPVTYAREKEKEKMIERLRNLGYLN